MPQYVRSLSNCVIVESYVKLGKLSYETQKLNRAIVLEVHPTVIFFGRQKFFVVDKMQRKSYIFFTPNVPLREYLSIRKFR